MSTQLTIEDMNSFISALKYSQTLVNTANTGADLAFDFLRSYDYYGSVRMAVAATTSIEAPTIVLKGYNASDFFAYNESDMTTFFYKASDGIPGSVIMMPIDQIKDTSIMTKEILSEISIMKDGSIESPTLSYDPGLSFDYSNDDDNTVFPIRIYDQEFYKNGETIGIDSADWDVSISLQSGSISKERDSSSLRLDNVRMNGGISSPVISFASALESRESILSNSVREDGLISDNAVVPEEVEKDTNIFTMNKFSELDIKKNGDEVEIHLASLFTDAELIEKVDTFYESSGASSYYNGEDAFITQEQAEMLAEHIYRKVTGVQKTSIQI